jgi:hypothetical protein
VGSVLTLSKGKGKGYPLKTSPLLGFVGVYLNARVTCNDAARALLPQPYDSFRTADLYGIAGAVAAFVWSHFGKEAVRLPLYALSAILGAILAVVSLGGST